MATFKDTHPQESILGTTMKNNCKIKNTMEKIKEADNCFGLISRQISLNPSRQPAPVTPTIILGRTLLSGKNSCACATRSGGKGKGTECLSLSPAPLSQSAGIFARLRLAQKRPAKRICPSLTTEMSVNVAKRQKGENRGR